MATAAFLKRADARSRSPVILVVLSLRARGSNPARTLRLASRTHIDQQGYAYDACVLDNLNLDYGGGFMESGWQAGDCTISLADRRLSHQTPGQKLSRLLYEYDMVGTPVTVYQSFTDLPLWADVLPIFRGEVADVPASKVGQVSLHLVQDRKWVRSLPNHTVERNSYPDSPQDSVGKGVPAIYGDFRLGRENLVVGSPGNIASWYAGVARAPMPLLPVGSQTAERPKWIVAGHSLYPFGSDHVLIEDRDSGLLAGSYYATTGALDAYGNKPILLDSTSYSRFDLCILPVEAHVDNTAADWLESVRPDKGITLSGFAQIDVTASQDLLKFQLPDVTSRGTFVSATARIWYAKNASSSVHPVMGMWRSGTSFDDTVSFDAAASSTYPSDTPLGYKSLVSTKITLWEHFKDTTLYCRAFNAGEKVQVHRICVTVQYIPAASVIKPGRQTGDQGGYTVSGRKNPNYSARTRYYGTQSIMSPDLTAFDAGAYIYNYGYADDASGTYTGLASTLIQHPADIIHHALCTYGGATASEITTGVDYGSFALVRSSLGSYKAHCHLSSQSDVPAIVEAFSSQFLCWFFRLGCDEDGAWAAIPWDVGSATDYRSTSSVFRFGKDEIVKGSLRVKSTPISKVRNVVRVNYDYDLRTRSFAQQVFIAPADSRGWNGVAEVRDQNSAAPYNRETLCAGSVTTYGLHELVHDMTWCNDSATATDVRNRLFDLLYKPRLTVTFSTFMHAADLERGRIIELAEEWDNLVPFGSPGSDGSWLNKGLRVVRTSRRDSNPTVYEVEAVEVGQWWNEGVEEESGGWEFAPEGGLLPLLSP